MQLTVSVPVTTRKVGGGPGITFRTGRPWRASGASGSLRSRRATFAAGARRALCPGLALRALRSDGARWARRTGSAAFADGALWTDGSLRTLCTLRASRTDRPWRASFARRSGRTLRPWCRTATRHHENGDGSRNCQQLSHRNFPRDEQDCTGTSTAVKQRENWRCIWEQSPYANVRLELAGRDGDVKLPLMSFLESLLNTTSGSGFHWWLSGRGSWYPFLPSHRLAYEAAT